LTILTTVTLASSNSALPDDGDCTETCWSCFNVNFSTSFKAILLCISLVEKLWQYQDARTTVEKKNVLLVTVEASRSDYDLKF